MTPIAPISDFTAGLPARLNTQASERPGEIPFSRLITGLIDNSNQRQQEVQVELQRLATGESDHVHDLVVSVAKADLALRMVLEIRNQLIASYQDVMRMQM